MDKIDIINAWIEFSMYENIYADTTIASLCSINNEHKEEVIKSLADTLRNETNLSYYLAIQRAEEIEDDYWYVALPLKPEKGWDITAKHNADHLFNCLSIGDLAEELSILEAKANQINGHKNR